MKRFIRQFIRRGTDTADVHTKSPPYSESGALSLRGQAVTDSIGGGLVKMLKVWNNSYHPLRQPDGYVNIGVAENYIMFDDVKTFINQNLEIESELCSYGTGAIGSPQLRSAMANFWNEQFDPFVSVAAEHVIFSAGCTAICEMLGWVLADRKDAILMSAPIYGSLNYDFTVKSGLRVEHVSTGPDHPTSIDSVKYYEQAILDLRSKNIRPRLLLICNPHNPLGSFYDRKTLVAFCNLCAKYDLHLISDEVYALSAFRTSPLLIQDPDPFPSSPFVSLLSLNPETHQLESSRSHVLYGFSKDFAAGGLRLGCLISQANPRLLLSMTALSLMHYPSSLSDKAAQAILNNKPWRNDFILKSQKRLQENYIYATHVLKDAGIHYFGEDEPWMSGFYIWFDLSQYLENVQGQLDIDRIKIAEAHLIDRIFEAKVFVGAGPDFSADKPGHFRLIFAQELDILKEGLRRLITVVEGVEAAERAIRYAEANAPSRSKQC